MVLREAKICLSKVIRLRDAFTNEPVSAGIRLKTLSGGRVEKKREGYFLFLGVSGSEFEIETESPIYQTRKLRLRADQGEELEEIWMYPSSAYPLRAGHTAVRGRAKPGSVLRFHVEDERGGLRLVDDYQKGDEDISFYRKGGIWSVIWYIRKKQEQAGEYFSAKQLNGDPERCMLGQPLAKDYQKKDTAICPAQESIADEDGEFYLLLKDLPKETCTLHYVYESGGQETCGKAEIFRGKENRILDD